MITLINDIIGFEKNFLTLIIMLVYLMTCFNQLTNSWESQLQITSIITIPSFLYIKIVICLEISDDQILLSDYYYLIIIDKDSLIGLNELTK